MKARLGGACGSGVTREATEESPFELSLVILDNGELVGRERGIWRGNWGLWPGRPMWKSIEEAREAGGGPFVSWVSLGPLQCQALRG